MRYRTDQLGDILVQSETGEICFQEAPHFPGLFYCTFQTPCMQRSPIQTQTIYLAFVLRMMTLCLVLVKLPDEDAPLEHMRGAGFKEACLVISLQNLGLPVYVTLMVPSPFPLGIRYCVSLVFSYVTMICPLCRMANTLCIMYRKSISLPCPCGRTSSRSSTTLRLPRSPCLT